MAVQDDARERDMRSRFNLDYSPERKRDGIDAQLELDGELVEFELKSTAGNSISTVRDFNPDHIVKWEKLHWIFGFYDEAGEELQHAYYLTPDDMAGWIESKAQYVAPDYLLAEKLPELVTDAMMVEILGDKDVYTIDDARAIHKKQMSKKEYLDRMDCAAYYSRERVLEMIAEKKPTGTPEGDTALLVEQLGDKSAYGLGEIWDLFKRAYRKAEYEERIDHPAGYSRTRMLEILQDRCRYLIERGSTLNNPHISASYFEDFDKLEREYATELRDRIRAWRAEKDTRGEEHAADLTPIAEAAEPPGEWDSAASSPPERPHSSEPEGA